MCPGCETSFVAGEAKPRSPRVPDAILADPATAQAEADAKEYRGRRSGQGDATKPAAKKSPPSVRPPGIGIAAGSVCCFFDLAQRLDDMRFVDFPPPPRNFDIFQAPPPINVPERMLSVEEQKEHATTFFEHFSRRVSEITRALRWAASDREHLLKRHRASHPGRQRMFVRPRFVFAGLSGHRADQSLSRRALDGLRKS